MQKYMPGADLADINNVYGYCAAQTGIQVFKQCGQDLSRENIMRQAANLDIQLPMFQAGIRYHTTATDYPGDQAAAAAALRRQGLGAVREPIGGDVGRWAGRCDPQRGDRKLSAGSGSLFSQAASPIRLFQSASLFKSGWRCVNMDQVLSLRPGLQGWRGHGGRSAEGFAKRRAECWDAGIADGFRHLVAGRPWAIRAKASVIRNWRRHCWKLMPVSARNNLARVRTEAPATVAKPDRSRGSAGSLTRQSLRV